jgi:hypothetical protein
VSLRTILWVVAIVVSFNLSEVLAAYDSAPGATADSCSQVTFSAFKPPQFSQANNNTEVAPNSEFSFHASKATIPNTIKVTIKGETVPVTVKPQHDGFQVTGKIPPAIKGAFIRIEMMGKGPSCERGDGWLLKVGN